jgi:hypothetical protein
MSRYATWRRELSPGLLDGRHVTVSGLRQKGLLPIATHYILGDNYILGTIESGHRWCSAAVPPHARTIKHFLIPETPKSKGAKSTKSGVNPLSLGKITFQPRAA